MAAKKIIGILLNEKLATDLMTHAIEEMGYLSDFLPELFRKETGTSNASPSESNG